MSSNLYIEQVGLGPQPLLLIHGWGMNGAVWQTVVSALQDDCTLYIVDLPGYGFSRESEIAWTAEAIVAAIAAQIPAETVWLGWSLGGLIALHAAQQGISQRTIVTGTSPCFCQQPDWPHAMPQLLMQQFANELQQDYTATLLRFIGLQSQGSLQAKQEIRYLKQQLFSRGEPQPAALIAGLAMLQQCDLRRYQSISNQPVHFIHGSRDMLAPMQAIQQWLHNYPTMQLHPIAKAGHAPFLSHTSQFTSLLQQLCRHD